MSLARIASAAALGLAAGTLVLAGCGSSSDSSSTPARSTATAATASSKALRKAGAAEGGTVQCALLPDRPDVCVAALNMSVLDSDKDLTVPSPFDWPIAVRMPDDSTTWQLNNVDYGVRVADCWVQKTCSLDFAPGDFQQFDGGAWYVTTLKTVNYQILWQDNAGPPMVSMTFSAQ